MRKVALALAIATALGALVAPACVQANQAHPYKIYLSMSYIGNDWQAESENMIKALAASKAYKDKVDLHVQVAGPSAQKQTQQLNAMVQAGADVIILYAISGTQLNKAIKNACAKGIVVYTYDSPVTEPCANNLSINNENVARTNAEWLVDKLGHKGKIVMIDGVPGTSADTEVVTAAKKVFAGTPGITILAEAPGMWSQAVGRSELSKIVATHSWSDIDGVWMALGCNQSNALQDEAGMSDDKKKPCASGPDNGFLVQMLPINTEVAGAIGSYRPMGAPGISTAAPVYQAALAMKLAVDALDAGVKPKGGTTFVPLVSQVSGSMRLCKEGTWAEMNSGCNVFAPSTVSNPGWQAGIFSVQLPQLGLTAAMSGKPEE